MNHSKGLFFFTKPPSFLNSFNNSHDLWNWGVPSLISTTFVNLNSWEESALTTLVYVCISWLNHTQSGLMHMPSFLPGVECPCLGLSPCLDYIHPLRLSSNPNFTPAHMMHCSAPLSYSLPVTQTHLFLAHSSCNIFALPLATKNVGSR